MRGARYIHEQPNFDRKRRSPGVPFESIVVGGMALALAIMAWAGLQSPRSASEEAMTNASAVAFALVGAAPRKLDPGASIRDCPTCPEVVVAPKGFFVVGAGEADPHARPQERPRRGASVTKVFAIGRYEVTVDEFAIFVADTAGVAPQCEGVTRVGQQPQNCVSWRDASAYVQWLSARTGRLYRLPSADEWEYAAKAHGLAVAEPAELFQTAAAPASVTNTMANGFGLHGMGGNIAELVADCWLAPDGETMEAKPEGGGCSKRTVKDGSWLDTLIEVRPTAKRAIGGDVRSQRVGLRVLRELTDDERGN